MIDEVGVVAGHAHAQKRDHQAPLIGLGKEAVAPPFFHNAGDNLQVLGVQQDHATAYGEVVSANETRALPRQDNLTGTHRGPLGDLPAG